MSFYPQMTCEPANKHLNLSLKSILPSINFSRRVVLIPFYSCLCISQRALTAGMSCQLTFKSIDRQPPSMLGEQKRQMWRAVKRRRKPACDWYGCHRERSEPCLKKGGYRFCCPLNKQRDVSAPPLQTLTSAILSKITPHVSAGLQLNCLALIVSCVCHYFCIVTSRRAGMKAYF